MLPRKIFENSRTAMAILVHFEQISGKFYRNSTAQMAEWQERPLREL